MFVITDAKAEIRGSEKYPELRGIVLFGQKAEGVMVTAEIWGLPAEVGSCENGNFFAFHIHEGETCGSPSGDSPFAESKMHYNPTNANHPCHAGDLPPLLSSKSGYAYTTFLTDRFKLSEVIGRTVVIHLLPDDFKTQPSGGSGEKIACGKIETL